MVRVVDNISDIVSIWQEAFGDSEEDIRFFADNLVHGKCIGIYDEDKLVSMLYLVDCNYKSGMSSYVYAACTRADERGKGYMTALLDYCKQDCQYGFCLIPANQGLINYYKQRGLVREISADDISFDENDEIIEYLFEGCELEAPFGLMYEKGDN